MQIRVIASICENTDWKLIVVAVIFHPRSLKKLLLWISVTGHPETWEVLILLLQPSALVIVFLLAAVN